MITKLYDYLFNPVEDKPDIKKPLQKIKWFFIIMFIDQIPTTVVALSLKLKNPAITIIVGVLGFVLVGLTFHKMFQHHSIKNKFKWSWQKAWQQSKIILTSIASIIILIVGTSVLIKRLSTSPINNTNNNQDAIQSFIQIGVSAPFIVIFAVLLAPIFEEFCFRYLFLNNVKDTPLNKVCHILLSGICFSYAHMLTQTPTNFNLGTWISFISTSVPYLVIGIVLATVFVKYQNIQLNIKIHMTWNIMAMSVILIPMLK